MFVKGRVYRGEDDRRLGEGAIRASSTKKTGDEVPWK